MQKTSVCPACGYKHLAIIEPCVKSSLETSDLKTAKDVWSNDPDRITRRNDTN